MDNYQLNSIPDAPRLDEGPTPFDLARQRMEQAAARYKEEMERLTKPEDHQEEFRRLMHRLGRGPRPN